LTFIKEAVKETVNAYFLGFGESVLAAAQGEPQEATSPPKEN
jgi:hypothetical protein